MYVISKKLMKQTYFNYNLNPNLSIDDYFVGTANIKAFNFLIKDININNKFLLIGPAKSGKSHLSNIWQQKNQAIKYINNIDFILNKKQNILIDNLLDNINEEEIFHLINHSLLNKLKILITSSDLLINYKFKLNDLSSRINTFHNIKISLPDDEMLMNLMIKLFHDKQIIIKNSEIFEYIIKRVNRSYEKVFVLIDNIDKLLLQKNKQLTIPLIKELI